MSDERALHDEGMHQDWAGGPPIDPRGAEVEAEYQAWVGKMRTTEGAHHPELWPLPERKQEAMPPELGVVQDHIRSWLRDQLGLPVTDYAQDRAQDERAVGPTFEQELRCQQLESEAEGRDAL